jgi:hypothetical protein
VNFPISRSDGKEGKKGKNQEVGKNLGRLGEE